MFLPVSRFLTAIVVSFTLVLSGCGNGGQLDNKVPVVVNHPDPEVSGMLRGWTAEPKSYAKNRIVLTTGGYKTARYLSIKHDRMKKMTSPSKLKAAIKFGLKKEGVTNVQFKAIKKLNKKISRQLGERIGDPGATYWSWIVTGKSKHGPVKAAGYSVINKKAENPGASVEVFIASPKEFKQLGGYAVTAAMAPGTFRAPADANMRDYGTISNKKAAEHLDEHLLILAARLLGQDAVIGIMNEQTRTILLGLDQMTPYGLQDPMYEW